MIPKTIIHLLSGGLDSVTLLYDLKQQGHNVHCLLCDYKQRHVQELLFARGHCRRLGVLYSTRELPELGGLTDESWVVPFRNAVLISVAVNLAVKANADTVTIGCNADDAKMFPDCRKTFIDPMNKVVKACGYDIEICAPYLGWMKWKIAAHAQEMGVPSNEIWSCYRGGTKPCGTCPACIKLKEALDQSWKEMHNLARDVETGGLCQASIGVAPDC